MSTSIATITPTEGRGAGPQILLHQGKELEGVLPRLERFLLRDGPIVELSRHPGWFVAATRSMPSEGAHGQD